MKALYYERTENDAVRCGLCPHRCNISEGKKGICGVRRNQGGTLSVESYGRITSMALDPIEKKPLYHFYPGTKILSVGCYGCNFKCGFCQNYSISMNQAPWREFTPKDVAAVSAQLSKKGNIGVAFTYNEPFIGYEYVMDCAKLISKQEQKSVLVTNGFICEKPLKQILPFVHAMNIDLKSFQDEFYKEIGGSLDDVKRTIEIAAAHCHVEITTLIIPGKNDSEAEIYQLSKWLSDVDKDIPLHISRFFPMYKLQDSYPTPKETIYLLADTARKNLRYVYAGNIL